MRPRTVLSLVAAALVLTGTLAYLSWEAGVGGSSGGAVGDAPTAAPVWLELALIVLGLAVVVLSFVELRHR